MIGVGNGVGGSEGSALWIGRGAMRVRIIESPSRGSGGVGIVVVRSVAGAWMTEAQGAHVGSFRFVRTTEAS